MVLRIVVALGVFAALAFQYRLRIANEWQQYAQLPMASAPQKGDRVIVFAPHCDDETLGCGGMLAEAKRNGADVRVVILTNGDGFLIAAGRAHKTVRLTREKIIKFAYIRQRESIAALRMLGVNSDEVDFLGYPDRGLARLWDRNWSPDTLYTSRSTGLNRSPYVNSYTRNAPYCGESVIADIQNILKSTKPTHVYVPHPLDNHSDHYATYCFVTAAVEQLRSEACDFTPRLKTHAYLVHRGDWPVPRGYHRGRSLAPPHSLTRGDTHWSSLALSPDVVEMKKQAIKQYRTQTDIEPGFLMSFAGDNELIGKLRDRIIDRVEPGGIVIDGNPEDWHGVRPSVVDPVGDYVFAGMNKGGDVRSIYACTDDENLYLRLDCVRKLSRRVTYTLSLRGAGDDDSGKLHTISIRPPSKCSVPVRNWAYKGNMMELAIPLDQLSLGRSLFVQVRTRIAGLAVDNTGWHEVQWLEDSTRQTAARKRPEKVL